MNSLGDKKVGLAHKWPGFIGKFQARVTIIVLDTLCWDHMTGQLFTS